MFTLTESIENMLLQLDETPDNRVLIGICFDALLEANREKEAIELECRCWLKAKKRKPYDQGGEGNDERFFFCPSRGYSMDKDEIPEELTSWERNSMFPTEEEAIQDTVNRWLKLPRERLDALWLWEPPT